MFSDYRLLMMGRRYFLCSVGGAGTAPVLKTGILNENLKFESQALRFAPLVEWKTRWS